MARINLLTIHWGMCYGAVMQTYGTCRLLKEAGHEVRVINLISPKIKHKYLHLKSWKYIVREFLFWRFKKRYFSKLTPKTYSLKESCIPEADITIVGSDQVWNKDITGIFGYTYYLDFVPNHQKRIALSSSFGKENWDDTVEFYNAVKQHLRKFDAISIRESSGVNILKNEFGLESTHLLDPSLAWGHFDEMVTSSKTKNQIFTFLLNTSPSAQNMLKQISISIGIKLFRPSILEVLFKSGPCNWLSNIKNSRLVITDSFHGTALSIIFHKDFLVFCADEKKFTRIRSLLDLIGLSSRYVSSYEDFKKRKDELMQPIDYKIVDDILGKERIKYRQFIKDNIR